MGSCCCKADYPCGSGEETSVLLKDDSKTTCISEKVAVDTCVLQGDDEMRGADEKAEKPEVKQQTLDFSATQENGLLQKENAPVSPRSESEVREDATTAQPEQSGVAPAGGGNLLENASTAHGEDVLGPVTKQEPHEEVDPASARGISPSTEAVRPESPSHPETKNTSTEHTAASISPADGQEGRSEEAKPSGAFAQDDDVLPAPNPELAAAASVSEVPLETNTEAPGCAVTVGLDDGGSPCKEDGSVETKKHGAFWSFSSGPEPAELDPSEEKLDSGGCERNTEATSPAAAKSSLSFDKDEKPNPEGSGAVDFKEVTSSEKPKQDAAEETAPDTQDKDVPEMKEDDGLKEEEEGAQTETETTQPEEGPQNQEVTENKDELPSDVAANDEPATEEKGSLGNSEEDLYRGAEELSLSQVLKMEDRCSLSPAVDILSYSEREWKGNTAKSTLIKKGYKEMSQTFDGVRRVRGDNYCALRATLFQVLSQSTTVPRWLQEDDVVTLPKQLEAQEGLVSQWRFPEVCVQRDGSGGDAAQQLKGYVELLRNTWQAAVDCPTPAERQKLCERVFQGGEEELGLLEALKLLMLGQAAELHDCMLGGGDVPLFCWLLFARDSSDCPRSFLSNHLRHVGLSAGLEQVEMFLLGYALQHTIQVYRLYKANTEEFITFYPDDHKDDWPSVCLVTEDDRHYNVPVVEAAEPNEELASS